MDIDATLNRVIDAMAPHRGKGEVARYIPALAHMDPMQFGIAVTLTDGSTHAAGDADTAFSIQSISKILTLSLALEQAGESLWTRVGREPSGTPFNSIVQLEREHGIPRNPFINAGAIAVSDHLMGGKSVADTVSIILAFAMRAAQDETIDIDTDIARSEAETGARNRSLAHFMKSFGNMSNRAEDALSVYFHQCAITMTCRQLSRMGLFLATDGRDPVSGHTIISPTHAGCINALMLTCGHYDASGDFAVRIGWPGKSGVGGGILAVVPGVASIAAWSPGLNRNGNSLVGTLALEALARETGWSIFRSGNVTRPAR